MLCSTSRRGLSCAILFFLIVLLIPGNAIALFKEGSNSVPSRRVIANEMIVRFRSASQLPPTSVLSGAQFCPTAGIDKLFKKFGITKVEPLFPGSTATTQISSLNVTAQPGVVKLTISNYSGTDLRAIAKEFAADPSVEYAEPNYVFQVFKSPNDPYYSRQWGLGKVNAPGAWDAKTGSSNVIIAVIDTGVDYTHPDLAGNIWSNSDEIPGNNVDDDLNGFIDDIRGWDFVSVPGEWIWPGEDGAPEDNDPIDFVGHGTHVSGIAAGRSNNSVGGAGMAWDCKIMPVRAGYAASDGYGYLEYFDAARAIYYAADNGADVINMSWGGLDDSILISDAITYAHNKGCVLVASAGNVISEYASYPYYPAAYSQVIAVASTDDDDMLSIWNWFVFSNFGSFVDVCAPGSYILSTVPGGYDNYSGTSMAAPFVSGLAALIKSKYPYFTNEQIMSRIKDTADKIDDLNPDFLKGQLGAGRVNAHAALGNILIGIDYPRSGSAVGNNIIIKGSANIENFRSYHLEYGVGQNPNIWIPMGPFHSTPVLSGTLAHWDATGLNGSYSVRLTVNDISGESYSSVSKINISQAGGVELFGPPLPGPNPFNPDRDQPIKIRYVLGSVPSGGADVELCIYDITGTLIFRKKRFSAGAEEVNDVSWDGKNVFGKSVGNGVYPFILVADKKIVGKSKIAVIR